MDHVDLVGGQDNGWAVAMATLGHERTMAVAGSRRRRLPDPDSDIRDRSARAVMAELSQGTGEEAFPMASAAPLVTLVKRLGRSGDAIMRQRLMTLFAMESCARYTELRIAAAADAGHQPGPESSLAYLDGVGRARASRDLVFDILGPIGALSATADSEIDAAVHMALSTLAHGIQGGAEQIQRNIAGERVLGLSKEPQVDRDAPFRELKVGTQRE